MQAEEAARNPPPVVEIEPELSGTEKFVDTMKDLGNTIKDSVNNLAHNIPEPMSKVLQPITAALHPHSAAPAPAPVGADTEVHVDEIDKVRVWLGLTKRLTFDTWMPLAYGISN